MRGPKPRHGHSLRGKDSRTYRIWAGMVARCTIPSATNYENYGAKGIKVCERWRTFDNFLADMGEAPTGMSIDRFPNSQGDYEPGNCRWATRQEQNENRRSVRWIEHGGIRLTVAGWARHLGINKATMQERLAKWPLLQALGVEPRPPQVRTPPRMTAEVRQKLSEAAARRNVERDGLGRFTGK